MPLPVMFVPVAFLRLIASLQSAAEIGVVDVVMRSSCKAMTQDGFRVGQDLAETQSCTQSPGMMEDHSFNF